MDLQERQSALNLEFMTESGVNVTQKIFDGDTKIFKKRDKALTYAKKIRSYTYLLECYERTRRTELDSNEAKIEVYGYAVPK